MLQQVMHEKAGRKLHITYVRKIMRRHGLSPKASQKIHIRRANGKTVKNWQHDIKKWISRMENEGFVVVMEDEAFFVHGRGNRTQMLAARGKPSNVPHTGSHRKVAAYGSIARDGK